MKKHLSNNLSPLAPEALKGTARRTPFRGGVSVANVFILFLFVFSSLHSFSQNPLVKQWDYRFGGTDYDEITCFQQTKDGGYILGGYSYSGIGGDKTQATWGGEDYWIVKTDSLGNKEWDKDFGGTDVEELHSLLQTADGGYILGGYSYSGIGGDKTQANWGNWDYWIVKTDSLGNKEWDKDFGGTDDDALFSLQQTADGGYILGGFSLSGISGDKTQATWGSADYWIVKTDSLGNKEWDKDFGGTDDDDLFSLQQTADGGYILGGLSYSGIGGDKTQATWGVDDFWIVKTDSAGIKQWDKDFGGTNTDYLYSVNQTKDGGYLLAGYSASGISGDKTENNLNAPGTETWVVKTDPAGIKQWDKTLQVNGKVGYGFAIQTREGCYAMANDNDAPAGGDKTQDSWNNSKDYWIIKFCETLQAGFTSPSSLCPGTCTDFVNLSLNATSYQWSFPGATPDTSTATNPTNICYANSGSYNVQLIATNTNGSDTLLLSNYITVYPSPAAQAIAQSGDTLFANAGAASYQWYFNTTIINGATNYFYVAPSSGDYNVVATDANGCEVEAAVFNVIAAVLPSPLGEGSGERLYPNPVVDKLEIVSPLFKDKKEIDISIYNLLGEKVLAVSPLSLGRGVGGEAIDCGLLPSGIYYLEVTSGNKVFRSKFIKQ